MKTTLILYGKLADIAGRRLTIDNCSNTDVLRGELDRRYPGLTAQVFRMAVNNKIIEGNCSLRDGDEVCLLPPFSGG